GPELLIFRRSEHELADLIATATTSPPAYARPVDAHDLRYRASLTARARRSLRTYRRQFSDQEPQQSLDIVAARLHHFLPAALVDRPFLWPLHLARLVDRLTEMPSVTAETFLQRTMAQSEGVQYHIASELLTFLRLNPAILDDIRRRAQRRPASTD